MGCCSSTCHLELMETKPKRMTLLSKRIPAADGQLTGSGQPLGEVGDDPHMSFEEKNGPTEG